LKLSAATRVCSSLMIWCFFFLKDHQSWKAESIPQWILVSGSQQRPWMDVQYSDCGRSPFGAHLELSEKAGLTPWDCDALFTKLFLEAGTFQCVTQGSLVVGFLWIFSGNHHSAAMCCTWQGGATRHHVLAVLCGDCILPVL